MVAFKQDLSADNLRPTEAVAQYPRVAVLRPGSRSARIRSGLAIHRQRSKVVPSGQYTIKRMMKLHKAHSGLVGPFIFCQRRGAPLKNVTSRLGTAYSTRILPLLLMILTLPVVAQAQFNYKSSGGTITITKYTGTGGAVAIPSTINNLPVTTIGTNAFASCATLTSVTIPNTVTTIGDYAFYSCTSLTSAAIPNSVTTIGNSTFQGCKNLTGVTIPNSVSSIGPFAFYSCISLTSVTIGNGVTIIGDSAFYSCTSLTSVTIGNRVSTIGQQAFCLCTSLQGLTIPSNVNTIGNYAFEYCESLTSVTIGNGVSTIGISAFYSCNNLTSVTMGNSVSTIGAYAFSSCVSLLNLTLPNSVSAIGNYAFASCVSLSRVVIPNSVVTIGDFAFSSCNSLTSVIIGNSVIRMNKAFAGCNSLIAIVVDINNPAFSSLNGILFDKNLSTLVTFPAGVAGSYTIPNGVTAIGNYAFESCPRLASVMIPSSVTSIGTNAFASCVSLTRVTIPNSVSFIANYAFSGCTSLTAVYFQGNAPSPGGASVFGGDNKATIYYLPGTAGWGTTFAGRPAKLWNPQIQSSGPDFGVRTNGFGFDITGTTNIPILVEACTSLASASWIPLQTCTLTNGSVYFSDPDWTDYPARSYRIRSP